MHSKVPSHIVHYSRAEPFRSITATSPIELDSVVAGLNEKNSWGLNRFKDRSYLEKRFKVESTLRERFIEMGGRPILSHPIYFFLGRNKRFEEHPLNIGYAIALSEVHRHHLSFSYGDTMISFDQENLKLAGDKYRHPCCGRLLTFDELGEVMKENDFMPSSTLAIEAHLWIRPSERIVKKIVR